MTRWLAALCGAWLGVAAAAAAAHPEAAQRVVFLLQYVASDYEVAVRDGRVVDAAEYEENRDFVRLATERFGDLAPYLPADRTATVRDALRRLAAAVEARRPTAEVRAATATAIPILIEGFGLEPAPRRPPSPKRGAELYRENCAICHGAEGDGRGTSGGDLDPPPASFTDRARMDAVAPYVLYNAITFGVAGTGMAAFGDAFDEEQRWDLAFHLWSFSAPPGDAPPVEVSLRDLAMRSSAELAPAVSKQLAALGLQSEERAATSAVAALRARPGPLGQADESLARMRADVERGLTMARDARFDEAADVVTSAYFREFEPLEPELDRRDPAVRAAFEKSLIDFRAALRQKDSDAAARVAVDLERQLEAAGRALRPRAASGGTALAVAAVALAVVAVVAWRLRARRVARR